MIPKFISSWFKKNSSTPQMSIDSKQSSKSKAAKLGNEPKKILARNKQETVYSISSNEAVKSKTVQAPVILKIKSRAPILNKSFSQK